MKDSIASNYIYNVRKFLGGKHFRVRSYFTWVFVLFRMVKCDIIYLWEKHILYPRFLKSFYKLLPVGNYEVCKIAGRMTFGLKYSYYKYRAVWARQLINGQYRYYLFGNQIFSIFPSENYSKEKSLGLNMCDATGSSRELNSCFKLVSYNNNLLIMDCIPNKVIKNDVKHFVDQEAVITKININIANYCGIRIKIIN